MGYLCLATLNNRDSVLFLIFLLGSLSSVWLGNKILCKSFWFLNFDLVTRIRFYDNFLSLDLVLTWKHCYFVFYVSILKFWHDNHIHLFSMNSCLRTARVTALYWMIPCLQTDLASVSLWFSAIFQLPVAMVTTFFISTMSPWLRRDGAMP